MYHCCNVLVQRQNTDFDQACTALFWWKRIQHVVLRAGNLCFITTDADDDDDDIHSAHHPSRPFPYWDWGAETSMNIASFLCNPSVGHNNISNGWPFYCQRGSSIDWTLWTTRRTEHRVPTSSTHNFLMFHIYIFIFFLMHAMLCSRMFLARQCVSYRWFLL